ncbi:hypothetical protein V4R08_10835 [Nitrobacter sp. NHB1]|uniref:hypothetical protein n=1 Tax=Nitrobacter sp. NHB1 TaxID=3119830 RepID=UPI002FFE25F8
MKMTWTFFGLDADLLEDIRGLAKLVGRSVANVTLLSNDHRFDFQNIGKRRGCPITVAAQTAPQKGKLRHPKAKTVL